MARKKRAMSSQKASRVKKQGHQNEENFSQLIGGQVSRSQQEKTDVTDRQQKRHSVKSGTWWQIFLYAQSRLENNTILQALGNLAPLMRRCLDAFPPTHQEYKANKHPCKMRLQEPMRLLAAELQKEEILKLFLIKSLFNGEEVNYLSILREKQKRPYHILPQKEVVATLTENIVIVNSKKRGAGQYDAQKVIFRRHKAGKLKNVGEIEVRTDEKNYGRIKCRFNASEITDLLTQSIPCKPQLGGRILVYGRARQTFKEPVQRTFKKDSE